VTPSPEPLALQPFLAGLVDGFRPMAEGKRLTLRLAPLAREGLDVVSDGGLLRSLLQNFLANALRYTERGGVVVGVRRRRAEDGTGWLRIDVVDTGVGIPADKVDSIFGEFTRLGDVEAEGLGLGLSLSERIARLLDARIEVSSRPGRGSRFSLWLAAGDGTAVAPPPVPVEDDIVAPDLRQRRLRCWWWTMTRARWRPAWPCCLAWATARSARPMAPRRCPMPLRSMRCWSTTGSTMARMG
jgi:hypothetical protein